VDRAVSRVAGRVGVGSIPRATFFHAMLALVLLFASATFGGSPPSECAALTGRAGANVWERAKAPELGHYCDLLASGSAKLANPAHIAADVVEIAEQAEAALPGRAAPMVLLGRAFARLGKYPEAVRAFSEAKARDATALDDPAALLAWARVLAYTGRTAEARTLYRALLPRAVSLTLSERGVAYVGAGMLAMAAGPSGVEEAVAILREARKNSQDAVQRVASLALALALDRSGEHAEARMILAERPHENAPALVVDPAAIEAMGPLSSVERTALVALALEATDPAGARSSWGSYLDGPGGEGPWAEHARQHLGVRPGNRGSK
jgi:tetratricopeptide (TPR) repeat protein